MLGMLRLESSSFYSKLAKHHNSELEDLAFGLPTPSGLIIFRLVPRFQGGSGVALTLGGSPRTPSFATRDISRLDTCSFKIPRAFIVEYVSDRGSRPRHIAHN
jgi:hypothetical protein